MMNYYDDERILVNVYVCEYANLVYFYFTLSININLKYRCHYPHFNFPLWTRCD